MMTEQVTGVTLAVIGIHSIVVALIDRGEVFYFS